MKKSQLRILVATLAGVLFGFVCYWIAGGIGTLGSSHAGLNPIQLILSRAVMGFAISCSIFKWNWILHGFIMGLIFSLPLAFDGLAIEAAEVSPALIFIGILVVGSIYGFLIELITSIIFKAPRQAKAKAE